MIVRLLGEGQFRLGSAHLDQLNELDNQIVHTLATGNEGAFRSLLGQMMTLVRRNGEEVPLTELVESDVVLPSEDISMEQARGLFTGEGIIPG